jgi:murein DD-endopeptidase MepM/ murein hydrolase activator NlpD
LTTMRHEDDATRAATVHARRNFGAKFAMVRAMTRYFTVGLVLFAAGAIAAASASRACDAKPPPVGPDVSIDGAPRFIWPVRGILVSDMCSDGSERRFKGIDIAVREGTPVKAAADGVVVYAGDALKGFGNVVVIRHDGGWATVYANARNLLVERGHFVRRGRPIALSGRSFSTDTPLLHFEIRNQASPVDPLRVLPDRRGA